MTKTLTLGQFRAMTRDLDDDLPMYLSVEAICEGDPDTLHAVVEEVRLCRAGTGGLFSGPAVDHVAVFGNGVPDGICTECGKEDGQHMSYCSKSPDDEEDDVEVDVTALGLDVNDA